ncbi:hypothetical protein RDV84_12985 [Lysobacter yananisis]|uniref:Uncharacterized protein n=1 Tax=Lysobacter yananisis TaxID=1003114 RepID=A0ABY9PFR4_9GAMM|nr:hypothetical protein [Lysobacter yananisis]WMT05714.1 hypothetical protein RDV84_12985 [Lysobacter yananisis]
MASNDSAVEKISEDELQTLQSVEATPSGDPALRFIQHCQNWFEDWLTANKNPLEKSEISPNQIVMFVFSEAPDIERPRLSGLEMQWCRFFSGAHDQQTQGLILGNENFRAAYTVRPSISSLQNAFALAVDHLSANDVFVIAQLSQKRMMYHLPGADIEDWCANPVVYDSRLSEEPLSAKRIEDDVLEFHKTSLLYAKNPIAKFVWVGKEDPYKLQPNPEQRIQSYLIIYLGASYKHLRGIVDEELVGKGGRCDVRVMWPSQPGTPFQPYTTTMLELKVLVEGAGPTYHRQWITSGIKQANDYRRSDTEAVYTCVFDGRKDRTDEMKDLDKLADDQNVRLRRYAMEAPVDAKTKSATMTGIGKGKKVDAKTSKKGRKKAAKKAATNK